MTDTSAEKPVPERHAGTVMPGGRGVEQHGVPMYGAPDLIDIVDPGDTPEYAKPEPAPEPVPVKIVSEGGKERRMFRTYHAFARVGEAVQIVGQDDDREQVRIKNYETVTTPERVWIGHEAHLANSMHGYPLDPGAEIVLTGEGQLYAMSDDAVNIVQLAVMIEYAVGIK